MSFKSQCTETDSEIKHEMVIDPVSGLKKHACPFKTCQMAFVKRYRLRDHINIHLGECPHKCEVPGCDQSYAKRETLKRHFQKCHGYKPLYTTFVRCTYPGCFMELKNNQSLDKHYRRKHSGQRPFMCQYCDMGFHKHKQLQSHLFHHTGVPPMRCPQCNIGFVYKRDLNRHLRGHKKWECDIDGCKYTSRQWNLLRKHQSNFHHEDYVCDTCKRTYTNKNTLMVHVLTHLEKEDRSPIYCPFENCSRYYLYKRNLAQHINIKHKGKHFECAKCDKKFTSKQRLLEHLRFHDPEKPTQLKKPKQLRRIRKDAGLPRYSMAVKLSGIVIPPEEEKLLLKKDSEMNSSTDISDASTHSTSHPIIRRSLRKRKILLNCLGCSTRKQPMLGIRRLKVPEATVVSGISTKTHEENLITKRLSPVAPEKLPPVMDSLKKLETLDLKMSEVEDTDLSCDDNSAVKCELEGTSKKSESSNDEERNISAFEMECTSNSPGVCPDSLSSILEDKIGLDNKNYTTDKESNKENVECNSSPSALEQAKYLINCKTNQTAKNVKKKVLYKKERSATVKDAEHGQKERCPVQSNIDLRKWILVMKGMMELICPEATTSFV